jgi:BirA family biotin operon repressor/biotin-[acetyl-CoA-carboxylase] ligase
LKLPAPLSLTVLEEAASTNDLLKALARQGAPAGTALLARRQSGGRGRMGRSFYSPEGGLYLSLLLRPKTSAVKSVALTAAAAVSVCRVLEKHGVHSPKIKWVNDVYLEDRKICGILAESSLGPGGVPDWVVLGVGIDLVPPREGWPESLRDTAGAAFSSLSEEQRRSLCRDLLTELWDLCTRPEDRDLPAEYRARSLMPGRSVTVLQGDTARQADCLYIDDDYKLYVRFSDGSEAALDSGEVSLRLR